MKNVIKEFWERYEQKIVVVLAMVLVSVISFEIGALKGSDWQKDPLVIEKVPENQVVKLSDSGSCVAMGVSESNVLGAKDGGSVANEKSEKCEFVGSKNSNKYHKKTCSWATRIKEENRVCFESIEDAKSKNYVPAGCCMK
ncbi:MAG: hypothetical protein OEV93_00790 [Candidatus Moranbacteria bacterium]|nr:hypothetical protein [Candidatus Moranbacteria bacterium]